MSLPQVSTVSDGFVRYRVRVFSNSWFQSSLVVHVTEAPSLYELYIYFL